MSNFAFYLSLLGAGGVGSILRYQLNISSVKLSLSGLPFATLSVNCIGSLAMGFLSLWFLQKSELNSQLQTVILTGFLGGFTTFSAFSIETVRLFEQYNIVKALAFTSLAVVLPLLFCLAGVLFAKRII